MRRAAALALAAMLLLLTATVVGGAAKDDFDHEQHRKLFPTCGSCHMGVTDPSRPVLPSAASCASCHDGQIEKTVDWKPRTGARPGNLRFTHMDHQAAVHEGLGADSSLACGACHTPSGTGWMTVQRAVTGQCLSCHGIRVAHLEAPDTACATCHVTLAEARALPRAQVASFKAPVSHEAEGFGTAKGHGKLALPPAGTPFQVSPSCATCHARDFCASCHVNAPEVKLIQALAPDARSLAHKAELEAPASHSETRFLTRHGAASRRDITACTTCHTAESCVACHRSTPAVARLLPAAGPGRGAGARIVRTRPTSHNPGFADSHGPMASATPASCSACHARTECLDCHRPNAGGSGSYHPAGFLTRHPASAYNRQSDCTECHNQAEFCASCHVQAGLRSTGTIGPGYHDAASAFLVGHGVAARQSIESCVTCHTERDCLQCHSAQGGRRFNPHGPGFDPERLRRRNPQTCAACHGRAIPTGDD